MTVKEELRRAVEQLDDAEAATVLGYVRLSVSKDMQMLETITRHLLGRLAAEDPARVRALLDAVATDDPVGLSLAPVDDEPLTPEEVAALDEAYAARQRGDVVTDEELRRELGV